MRIPKGCTLFQRKSDNRWEAYIMINGKQKFVACRKDKRVVYDKLIIAHNEKKRNLKKVSADDFTLFSWLDHWLKIYRLPKEGTILSKNTIIMDKSMIKKIKQVFKNKKLRNLTADYIQERLNSMNQWRTAKGVYTVLKLALEKAKDRTNNFSIMSLVEIPRYEPVRGRALTKNEIDKLLDATKKEVERDIIKFYIYTGCRMDELTRTLVEYVNLTDEVRTITGLTYKNKSIPDMTLLPNEILICGTKTRGSIRTMPIMPPLRHILQKLLSNRSNEENLFNYSQRQIIYFYRLIKTKTKIDFTLKDFRHTTATSFKDAGIPLGVYYRWFGWSNETMARRIYP